MSERADESTEKVGHRREGDDDAPDLWDRTAAGLAAHGALPFAILLCIVQLWMFAGVFRGEPVGDDLTFHMAESVRLADCIRAGDWDWWNPSANAGFASAYYYQVVPQLASAIPAALFGHHLFWFQLSVVLPLVLAPLAAWRGMRLMGATPWQAAIAALALSFTIGQSRWGYGADGTFSVGLYTQTWALAAFPLALGHAIRWATAARGLGAAIAWSAFVGLCHPFAVIALGLALLVGYVAQLVGVGVRRGPARTLLPMFLRLAGFAVLLAVSLLPVLVPLLVDYIGFGGFPHRVADEVGPGFGELASWFKKGMILDHGRDRAMVLTLLLPVVIAFARAPFLAWLWAAALIYALLLGLGPHLGKTGDDLLPAVRFLGAMQAVLGLAIGAGMFAIGAYLWDPPPASRTHRLFARIFPDVFWSRTAISALAAALAVLLVVGGVNPQRGRVRVLADYPASHVEEMRPIIAKLGTEPPGRKQVGPGTENHWWNLLSYVYARVPATLQMGGGGLQASPNYDFLWSVRDVVKTAWVFDAPYHVYDRSKAAQQPIGDTVIETGTYLVRRLPAPGLVSPIQITGVMAAGPTGQNTEVRKTAIAWLRSRLPLENKHLAYHGHGGKGPPPEATVLRAWRTSSPDDHADIHAEVEVSAPSTFVFRESWHPRWHAFVDGREVPVRRVTPDFPAIDVPAGAHLLQLRFERPWWAHAAWLAWPLAILLGWAIARRRQPSSSTSST